MKHEIRNKHYAVFFKSSIVYRVLILYDKYCLSGAVRTLYVLVA